MESKYFSTQEFVDEETYELLGDDAIKLIDPDLIETVDIIREILGVPLICNNWHWGGSRSQCGYRSKKSKTGSKNSYHKQGKALDLISTKMTAKEMREKIKQEEDKLPLPIRIEKWDNNGEISWLHIDLGNTRGNKIYFFKA